MEFIIRFAVNLFDLGIFWYYLRSFKKMKRVPMAAFAVYLVIMAAIWATVNSLEKPYLNLLTLVLILLLTTLFFQAKMWSRIANIVIFIGAAKK